MADLASALLAGTRKRKFHEQLAADASSTAPTPSWGAALARALQGGIAGMIENRERDSDGTEFDRLFGPQAGVQSPTPSLATALTGESSPAQTVRTAGRPVQVIEGDGPSPLDPPSGKDRDIAIRTMYGEDPGASALGVANVMRRRAIDGNFGGNTLSQVAMAKGQFEPWARPDQKARMMALSPDSPTYQRLGQTLDQAYAGNDPTGGATHFYAPQVQASLGRQAPKWDQGPSTTIGPHKFIGGVGQPEQGELPPNAQLAQGQMPPQMAQPQQTRVAPQIPPHIMGQARKLWQEGDRAAAGALMQPYLTPKDQWVRQERPGKGDIWVNSSTGEPKFEPPGVNVALSADKEGSELFAKKGVEAFDAAQTASRDATKRVAVYGQMAEAMKGFEPGATAELRLRAAQIAKDIGIPVDANGVASGETFKAAQRKLELAATPRGQGQITENERTLIREQIPQLATSPGGVVKITQMLDRLDRYDMQVAKLYRDNARKNGGKVNYLDVLDDIEKLGPPLSEAEMSSLQSVRQGEVPRNAPAQGGQRNVDDLVKQYRSK
jgi:hypothetical protein